MTVTAPEFVLEEVSHHRRWRNSIANGVALTAAFVAAGAVVASMTLSPAPTPGKVLTAYVEAGFGHDWSGMWNKLCTPAQAAYDDFAEYADVKREAFHLLPRKVDVSLGRPHVVTGRPAAVTFSMTVESDDQYFRGWTTDGELTLIRESDEWRVCPRELVFG